MIRRAEELRNRIMRNVGTSEEWVVEEGTFAMHYRKPLRPDEINQMAPTPEVKDRQGRP